nr:C39 family peptidase [Planosporangium flavigriseum]
MASPAPTGTRAPAVTKAAVAAQAAAPAQAQAVPAQPPTPPPPPASKVLNYQFQLQPNYYYCGPAATRIALSASGHLLSQDEIATKLGTTTGGTNSAHDTTRALNSVLGANVYQTREIPGPAATTAQTDQLQADAVRAISGGRALVTNVVGAVTDIAGGFHSYGGGHYVSVVGYEDNGRRVKVADPANANGDGTYWVTTINMTKWMVNRGYSY